MRAWTGSALCLLVLAAPSQEKDSKTKESPSRNLAAMKQVRRSVDRALHYLAAQQNKVPDGSFPAGDAGKHAPVGVTALGALAFMAAGSAGHGPYTENALRAVDYLLDHCELKEGEKRGYIHADNDAHSNMHGQGYAALALAEAYGWYGTKRGKAGTARLRDCLASSVQLIQSSQGDSGGWFYTPHRNLSHEGSVTITLVQALRAARNAGFKVDTSVIDRAVAYIRKLQKEDGSFRYQLGGEESTAALTAAGIATLNATGNYDGPAIEKGIQFLIRKEAEQSLSRQSRIAQPFPAYQRLYAAQAFYQHRDRNLWHQWFERTREKLLAEQREDGSWDEGSEFGSTYTTAVNCLVLAVSFDYLPIFQR